MQSCLFGSPSHLGRKGACREQLRPIRIGPFSSQAHPLHWMVRLRIRVERPSCSFAASLVCALNSHQKMNEASSLLRATCSQFISTLEECMKFANTRLAPELYHPSTVPEPSDFVGTKLPHSHRVRLLTTYSYLYSLVLP